jgi:hypothetical protein
MSQFDKRSVDPAVIRDKFFEIARTYPGSCFIYTDGSKSENSVAAAAYTVGNIKQCRLPSCSSVYTAECKAILMAYDIIENSCEKSFVICSDSLSCLQALSNGSMDHSYISDILVKHTSFLEEEG